MGVLIVVYLGRNGFSSNIRTISGNVCCNLSWMTRYCVHIPFFAVSDSNGDLTVLGEDALQLYHLLMNNVSSE